jgi:hypothetical protein
MWVMQVDKIVFIYLMTEAETASEMSSVLKHF